MTEGTVWGRRGPGWVGKGGLGLRGHPGLRKWPGLRLRPRLKR